MENNIEIINNLRGDVSISAEESDGKIIITVSRNNLTEIGCCNPGTSVRDKSGEEWIVCEKTEGGVVVVRKNLLEDSMIFGSNNNWKESSIREFLNSDYLSVIEENFGEDNIQGIINDLLSLDGYDDYGVCEDMVSILSLNMYRKYHKYIGNCESSYWLLTPYSTLSGIGAACVECVDDDGRVGCDWYDGANGVRPVLILKSSTVVSKMSK